MQLLSRKIALHPQVATAAVETGLLEPGPKPGPCLFPRSFQEKMKRLTSKGGFEFFKAIEPIQQTLGFLSGGWWEVVVLQKMVETGRFRDVRWSVNVGQRGGADLEEDIVALDGVQITYVSCKRGGQGSRLLPLLDEVRARAQTLGGTFTRCFLAIYQKPTGSTLANLLNRAKSLRIKLLFPENFSDPDPFL